MGHFLDECGIGKYEMMEGRIGLDAGQERSGSVFLEKRDNAK